MESGPERYPGAPRWVKVSGIVLLVLLLLLVGVLAFGGQEHGPGRHAMPEDGDDDAPPEHGGDHTRPPDHQATRSGTGAEAYSTW